MTSHTLLNNVDHKDLRVITTRSADYGDDVQCTITFSWEFRSVQAHYPILFTTDAATAETTAVALFGFEKKENLFLGETGWDASYIPLTIRREPFLIGYQQSAAGGADRDPVIHIDMDSPRVSDSAGEALFLAHGGISPFLEEANNVLNTIREGYDVSRLFIEELVDLELLKACALDVELGDGSSRRLGGFQAIDEEVLRKLDGDTLRSLTEKGFLEAIYMAVASLSRLRDLVDRKNARLEQ